METINNPTHDEIKKAAKALKDGHLVAFPTETVYGLGADATNEKAISRIYSVKGRPTDHPLIVHISSISQLDKWAIDIPDYAIKLAKEFWPGPMTLILKRSDLAKDFITGGQDSVGLRVPDQDVALALLSEFEKLGGIGIAAPSANRFGAVSPTTIEAVSGEIGTYLGVEDLMLDGGQCVVGVESTIINCTKNSPSILRPGAIINTQIEKIIRLKDKNSVNNLIKTSGRFDKHYSPKAKIILDQKPLPGQGYIALSKFITPKGSIRIAAPKNNKEFAQILYSALRKCDNMGLNHIVIKQPIGNGISIAVRDRLKKAANAY